MPCYSLTSFLFLAVWPGYAGLPLISVVLMLLAAGVYLSFRSVHYVPHVCVNQLLVGLCFVWFIAGGMLSAAAVIALKVPPAVGGGIALAAAFILLIVVALGALSATRRDWGASQVWLSKNARLKRFRAWDAEPEAPRGHLKSTAIAAVLALALVNLAGYVWLGDAQAFRIMLLPSLALIISVVLAGAAYRVFGSQLAAVIQLRRIEVSASQRFILGNIEALHRERRAHWLGRWLAPEALKLNPVHGLP